MKIPLANYRLLRCGTKFQYSLFQAELHFHRSAAVDVTEFITKLVHQKNTTATTFAEAIGGGWIREILVTKAAPLIGDTNGQTVTGLGEFDAHGLRPVLFVAMDDGVVYGFRKADQKISVFFLVELVTVSNFADVTFYLGDTAGIGSELEHKCVRCLSSDD